MAWWVERERHLLIFPVTYRKLPELKHISILMIPSTSVLISSAPLQVWLPVVDYTHLQGVLEAIWTELYWQWERKG